MNIEQFYNYKNISDNFILYYNNKKNINYSLTRLNNTEYIKNNIINDYSNYKYLCNFSYSIIQLKNFSKKLNLKVSGIKIELYKRLYFYMCIMNKINIIQKYYKKLLITKFNKLHGPALIKRNLCVNDTDFFTLDDIKDIHYNEFFSYKDSSNFIYGFNIKSIYNLINKNKLQNPYTLQDFDYNIIQNIHHFIKISKLLKNNIDININIIKQENLPYNVRLNNVFNEIDLLGNYTNSEWFSNLSFRKKISFLRELHDIWVYRADISMSTKLEIYPNGDPFLNYNLYFNNYNNYTNIQIANFNNICLSIIENFILYGVNDNSKSLGALYVLSALTIVSSEAANAMPWLYESVNYN